MHQQKLLHSFSRSDPRTPLSDFFFKYEDSRVFQLRQSCISFLTDPEQQDRQGQNNEKKVIEIPNRILQIIQKEHQQRNSAQNSILAKYLLRFKIFKEMSQKLSVDVVKQMIRQGDLLIYNQGDHLATQGKKMKKVRILLAGELGVISSGKQSENSLDLWDTLYQLVEKLGKQSKHFKLKNLSSSKNILQNQMQKSYVLKKQTFIQIFDFQCIDRIEPETFLDFKPLLEYDPKYSQTLGVIENQSLVFTLGIESFYECLFLFYNAKLNQQIKIFRKVPIFNEFENSKLKILIQRLKIVEFKKNQFIYKQGTSPDRFYLLTQGQIQISKTISIFAQNPNNLYKSRAKVSRDHLTKDIKILPYANFNGVYNYQPQQKLVVLTLVNPICVFGEQELIQNTSRQVNARVISLTAKMYEIFLSDIQQFCNKISGNNSEKKMTLVNFFSIVQESITLKKILYRQTKLSDMIEHQNKSKYKTLFVDQTRKKSNKRQPISRAISSQLSPRKCDQKEDDVPPAYNNFNYTEFFNQKQAASEMLPSKILSDNEVKVIRMTHTKFDDSVESDAKKKKADKSIRVRNRSIDVNLKKKMQIDNLKTMDSLNSTAFVWKQKIHKRRQNQKITLQQPLFNLNYFIALEHQQKRLIFQSKKKKLEEIYRHSPSRH